MNKKFFESLIGKPIEIFVASDMPKTTGIVKACDENFVYIDDEIWSYKLILGIRPVKRESQPVEPAEPVTPPVSEEQQQLELEPEPEPESEIKQEPKPEPKPEPELKPETESKTKSEPKHKPEPKPKPEPIVLPDREFSGVLTSFFPTKRWGFIKSEEVKRAGIPLRDGERVFVHINQIADGELCRKLLISGDTEYNIDVVFRLINNQRGVAADEVKEVIHVKLGELMTAQAQPEAVNAQEKSTEVINNNADESNEKKESSEPVKAVENVPALPEKELPYEEGEIDFFERYRNPPYGELITKGNVTCYFNDTDVVDPLLSVFLETTPNPADVKVKFIKTKQGSKDKKHAVKLEAVDAFPEDRVKEWEKSGLIEKAKERLKLTVTTNNDNLKEPLVV